MENSENPKPLLSAFSETTIQMKMLEFEKMGDDELRNTPEFYEYIEFLASDYLDKNPDSDYTELNQRFRNTESFIEKCFLNRICTIMMQSVQERLLRNENLVWDENAKVFVEAK